MVGFLKARLAGGDVGPEAAYRAKLVSALQDHHLASSVAPLTDVFVAPRLLAPQSALTEDALLDDGTATLHYLWPDLAAGVATVPPPSITLSELITYGRRVLVSGDAGAGKSTLLAYCAIRLAEGEPTGPVDASETSLPVHLHLANVEKQFVEPEQHDVETLDPLRILHEVLDQSRLKTRGLDGVLSKAAGAGRLYLLIDGWDELPGVGLGHAGKWLYDMLSAYPNTRILMSAPGRGFAPLFRLGFLIVGLIPWRRGQAITAGQKWAQAAGARQAPWVSRYWQPGQTALETGLRLNALLPFENGGALASRRSLSETLQQAVDKALKRQLVELDRPDLAPVYQRLAQRLAHRLIAERAWALTEESVAEVTEAAQQEIASQGLRQDQDDPVRLLAKSGLLVDATGAIRFHSPLVRDYLAALHLIEKASLAEVARRVKKARWASAIHFYMAYLGSRERLPKMAEPGQGGPQLYQSASWLTEIKGEGPWRQSVLIALGKRCLDTKSPPMSRQRAAAALAGTEDAGVAALMSQVIRQPEPTMRQVALAVLARVAPAEVVSAAPRMMSDSDPGVRAASVHALAWIESPAADEALVDALYSRDVIVSTAAAEALALKGTEDSFRALRDAIRSRQFSARQAARVGLRLIDEPWAAELLSKSVEADGVAFATSRPTPHISPEDEPGAGWRRTRPGEQSWLVAWAISRDQVVPAGLAAVPVLLEALQKGDVAIRFRAAATLGQLAIMDGVGPLKQALQDDSPQVRQAAYIALTKIARAWDTGV